MSERQICQPSDGLEKVGDAVTFESFSIFPGGTKEGFRFWPEERTAAMAVAYARESVAPSLDNGYTALRVGALSQLSCCHIGPQTAGKGSKMPRIWQVLRQGEVLPPHWTKAQLCLNPTESIFLGALPS